MIKFSIIIATLLIITGCDVAGMGGAKYQYTAAAGEIPATINGVGGAVSTEQSPLGIPHTQLGATISRINGQYVKTGLDALSNDYPTDRYPLAAGPSKVEYDVSGIIWGGGGPHGAVDLDFIAVAGETYTVGMSVSVTPQRYTLFIQNSAGVVVASTDLKVKLRF